MFPANATFVAFLQSLLSVHSRLFQPDSASSLSGRSRHHLSCPSPSAPACATPHLSCLRASRDSSNPRRPYTAHRRAKFIPRECFHAFHAWFYVHRIEHGLLPCMPSSALPPCSKRPGDLARLKTPRNCEPPLGQGWARQPLSKPESAADAPQFIRRIRCATPLPVNAPVKAELLRHNNARPGNQNMKHLATRERLSRAA